MNHRNDHDDLATDGHDDAPTASWWPEDGVDTEDPRRATAPVATGPNGGAPSGGWRPTNGTARPPWAAETPAGGRPATDATARPDWAVDVAGISSWPPSAAPSGPPSALTAIVGATTPGASTGAGSTTSRFSGDASATGGDDGQQGAGAPDRQRPTSVSRWVVAVLAGVAVAVLAVLGINAVASAATAADVSANVFGPFGGSHQNRNPPFSASAGRAGGRAGQSNGSPAGQGTGGRPAAAAPVQPATGGAGTASVRVDGTIATIDGQRLEVDTPTGRTGVELTASTTIRDSSGTVARSALVAGESVQVTGTRDGDLVTASTVEVVH
jgi:hypothetical protein